MHLKPNLKKSKKLEVEIVDKSWVRKSKKVGESLTLFVLMLFDVI